MGVLIVTALLALGAWSVFATFRRLRRARAGRRWWFAFGVLAIGGLAAGGWLTFNFEYQVSPRIRLGGFPIPLVTFHLEDGQWVDFVAPPYVMYPGMVADVVAGVAVALLPLLFASLICGGKRKEHETDAT